MAECGYTGAGMNCSPPPVFRKRIATAEVVSWCGRRSQMIAKQNSGNLTAVRYRDEIIHHHLMHVIDRQRELFQQDNAGPHPTRLTMDYLQENSINVLPWPSKLPDLNPIEHLWDHLDKRVRQRQHLPQTINQLCQMLQQEWRTIPRNNVRKLIESIPRRRWAELAARGGHTRY
jgi:transposase